MSATFALPQTPATSSFAPFVFVLRHPPPPPQVNPMSFIMEQAGGKAVTGTGRALEVAPTKVHQRSPIYLGCVRDVELVTKFLDDAAAETGGAAGGAVAGGAGAGGAAAGAGSA
jgi:hypothetical protein